MHRKTYWCSSHFELILLVSSICCLLLVYRLSKCLTFQLQQYDLLLDLTGEGSHETVRQFCRVYSGQKFRKMIILYPAGIFDVDSTLKRRRKSVENRKNIPTVVEKASQQSSKFRRWLDVESTSIFQRFFIRRRKKSKIRHRNFHCASWVQNTITKHIHNFLDMILIDHLNQMSI